MTLEISREELRGIISDKVFLMENKDGINKIFLDDLDVKNIIHDTYNVGGIEIMKNDENDKVKIVYKFANCVLNEIEVSDIEKQFLEIETKIERYKYKIELEEKSFENESFTFELHKRNDNSNAIITYKNGIYHFVINDEHQKFDNFKSLTDEINEYFYN